MAALSPEMAAEGWLARDHEMIGRRTLRTVEETVVPGLVVAWLPSTVEDPFLDENEIAVPLFKIRYTDGELQGDCEDLELCELLESLAQPVLPEKIKAKAKAAEKPSRSTKRKKRDDASTLSDEDIHTNRSPKVAQSDETDDDQEEEEDDDDDEYIEESLSEDKKKKSKRKKTTKKPKSKSKKPKPKKRTKQLDRRKKLSVLNLLPEWNPEQLAAVVASVSLGQTDSEELIPPAIATDFTGDVPYWLSSEDKREIPQIKTPTNTLLPKDECHHAEKVQLLNCGNAAVAAEFDSSSGLLVIAVLPSAEIEVCTEEEAALAVVEHLPSEFLELAGQYYRLESDKKLSSAAVKRKSILHKGALAVWRFNKEKKSEFLYRVLLDFMPLDIRIGEGHGHLAVLGNDGSVRVYGALPTEKKALITLAPGLLYKPQHCCLSCIRWSPHDPKLLMCGLNDGGAVVYSVPDPEAMIWIEGARCRDRLAPTGRAVRALCFDLTDPDLLILANDSGWIQIWRFRQDCIFPLLERRTQQVTLVSSMQCLPNFQGVLTGTFSNSQCLAFNFYFSKTELVWRHDYYRDAVYDLEAVPLQRSDDKKSWDFFFASSGADGTIRLAYLDSQSKYAPLPQTILAIRHTVTESAPPSLTWSSTHPDKLRAAVNNALYEARLSLKRYQAQLQKGNDTATCHILLNEDAHKWKPENLPANPDDPDDIAFAPKCLAVRSVRFARRARYDPANNNSLCLISASHCGLISIHFIDPKGALS